MKSLKEISRNISIIQAQSCWQSSSPEPAKWKDDEVSVGVVGASDANGFTSTLPAALPLVG